MRKTRKRPNRNRKSGTRTSEAPDQTRRRTLALIRNGAIGAVILGGVGVFSVRAVRATVEEQDLTRIGDTRLTVVQIHDPSCRLCTELQRQTRRAIAGFGEDELTYLVANIKTEAGSTFAVEHGVAHVTLVLFDDKGRRIGVFEGVRPEAELERIFSEQLAREDG